MCVWGGGRGCKHTSAGGGVVARAPVGSAAGAASVAVIVAPNATAAVSQALPWGPTACTPHPVAAAQPHRQSPCH